MNWVCKTENGDYEILGATGPKPISAVAEAPFRPNGKQVDKVSLLTIRRSYFVPGTATRVVLEGDTTPPMYYRNPVTMVWHTPVPDPVPVFWFRSSEWFAQETVGASEHEAARQVPQEVPFIEINQDALAAEEAELIIVEKYRKRLLLERRYEYALWTVKSNYPESEREAWPQKEAEAKEWSALSSTDKTAALASNAQPLLIGEALQGDSSGTASAKKAKVDAVAARVVANGLAYRTFSGECTGILKKALAEVQAVTGSLAEVEAALSAIEPAWPSLGG